jgi:hypothetical protein
MLKSFTIDDDLAAQDNGAIEVTLSLADGNRRWCFFMTPAALSRCGDWVEGTQVRFHYDAPHMIVVAATLDHALIERVLRDLDRQGLLVKCSLALEEQSA